MPVMLVVWKSIRSSIRKSSRLKLSVQVCAARRIKSRVSSFFKSNRANSLATKISEFRSLQIRYQLAMCLVRSILLLRVIPPGIAHLVISLVWSASTWFQCRLVSMHHVGTECSTRRSLKHLTLKRTKLISVSSCFPRTWCDRSKKSRTLWVKKSSLKRWLIPFVQKYSVWNKSKRHFYYSWSVVRPREWKMVWKSEVRSTSY